MKNLAYQFRVVTLMYPFETWSDPAMKDLFYDTIALKLKGYGVEYPDGVLPIDTADFIGSHIIVCNETKNNLKPVMSFKMTRMSRCHRHQINFPALGLVQAAEASDHIHALRHIMQKCEHAGRDMSYGSSWTADPEFRKNREASRELREYLEGLYVIYHYETGIYDAIVGGTPRFKTERLLASLGHNPIWHPTKGELPSINVKHLFAEEVVVMYLSKFTDHADQMAKKLYRAWDNRIEIAPDLSGLKKSAA